MRAIQLYVQYGTLRLPAIFTGQEPIRGEYVSYRQPGLQGGHDRSGPCTTERVKGSGLPGMYLVLE